MNAKCNQCGKRKPNTATASRSGGGSYRRASRSYRSVICRDCAVELLATLTPGHHSNDRWSVQSLRHAIELTAPSTDCKCCKRDPCRGECGCQRCYQNYSDAIEHD